MNDIIILVITPYLYIRDHVERCNRVQHYLQVCCDGRIIADFKCVCVNEKGYNKINVQYKINRYSNIEEIDLKVNIRKVKLERLLR